MLRSLVGSEMCIRDSCYAAGYNNISNFNRQFLVQKAMSPSRFRALLAENLSLIHI